MYYHVLATDYDGTLADHGTVGEAAIAALEALRASGRKLLMVTGRELPQLKQVFDRLDLFDGVVAENGALLYIPATGEERVLSPAPPADFVERLTERGVERISVGRSIVATWEPFQSIVLDVIREQGLELKVIFNKGAVMILPSSIDKASGLLAALDELGLSAHNVIGVGDAENDHAFLNACGCGVAVANAVPALKETADVVMATERGAGVAELIDALIKDETAFARTVRQRVAVGVDAAGEAIHLNANGGGVLIAGTSGIGKSTLATALTERFVEQDFQFCVLDPEGDYQALENAVVVGDAKNPPNPTEVLNLIRSLGNNVVINTLALQMAERPGFFATLLPELAKMRASCGRPHWLIIDEAHHLLPAQRDSASLALPRDLPATILITVHPETVAASALSPVEDVLALGPHAEDVMAAFCSAVGEALPDGVAVPEGERVLYWNRRDGSDARSIEVEKPRQSHKRHTRKYAEGELPEERSFYFRGPDKALNLRAQNLIVFLQLAEGVDPTTWSHHLRAGDYSTWFRTCIKDDALADEAAAIEADESLSAAQSRQRVADLINRRYAGPATGP